MLPAGCRKGSIAPAGCWKDAMLPTGCRKGSIVPAGCWKVGRVQQGAAGKVLEGLRGSVSVLERC